MKFKAHARMRSHPDFRLQTRTQPIDFDLGADGGLDLALGVIAAHAEAIPITVTLPFLRRRAGRQVVGTIGPFGLKIEPVEGSVRTAKFRLHGTLGKEGLSCEMEGKVGCETECDVVGKIPGKTGKVSLELGGHDHHDHHDHDHDHDDDHDRKC